MQYRDPPSMVALTGYGQPSDRAASLAAGFHAHLTKPLSPHELDAVMATLCPAPVPAVSAVRPAADTD
uniref:hypothetical protein n=1 Tax=Agrilutibacter solisilvae TaxID=2763317 RepID=UPI00387EA8BC